MAAITADHPFLVKHADKIHGVLSCFDRVIFRGYLPLSYPKGMSGFLYQQKVLLKDGGSGWRTILRRVRKLRPYSEQACRRLSSPVKTRRRISDQSSMLVSTPASRCQGHGRP